MVSNQPILFTLIITTFNSVEFLENILALVRENESPFVEIILVDDCSTDGTFEELSKHKYQSFKVIGKTENEGVSNSRNLGLKSAHGRYVGFLDADDQLLLNELVYQLDQIDKNINGNFDMLEFDYLKSHQLFSLQKPNKNSSVGYNLENAAHLLHSLLKTNKYEAPAWKRIYRLGFLTDNNINFFEGIYHEDEPWTYHVFTSAKLVVKVDAVFYYYRTTADSITTSFDADMIKKRAKDIQYVAINCLKLLQQKKQEKYYKLYSDYFSRMVMFGFSLGDRNYEFNRCLPLQKSYKVKTRLKAIVFAMSPKIYQKILLAILKMKIK